MENNINVSIDPKTFAGGAFIEKLNHAITQVISNIRDQNTDASEKREITVKLVFRSDKPYPKTQQIARIGNSVVPMMAQKLVEANCGDLMAEHQAAG